MKPWYTLPPGPEREAAKAAAEPKPELVKGPPGLRFIEDEHGKAIVANRYCYRFATKWEKEVQRILAQAGVPPLLPDTAIERTGDGYTLTRGTNRASISHRDGMTVIQNAYIILGGKL